jgi:hypothetical protein
MEEFWSGFVIGIISWYIFWWCIKQLLVMLVLKVAKKEIALMRAEQEAVTLKLEKHGDMFYCYRKDNEEFIGQAKTVEEIAELFKKKYPFNEAVILKEDVQVV